MDGSVVVVPIVGGGRRGTDKDTDNDDDCDRDCDDGGEPTCCKSVSNPLKKLPGLARIDNDDDATGDGTVAVGNDEEEGPAACRSSERTGCGDDDDNDDANEGPPTCRSSENNPVRVVDDDVGVDATAVDGDSRAAVVMVAIDCDCNVAWLLRPSCCCCCCCKLESNPVRSSSADDEEEDIISLGVVFDTGDSGSDGDDNIIWVVVGITVLAPL